MFDHFGATAGLAFCAVHAVQSTELIALDVFNSGARQITLGDVEHYIHRVTRPSPTVPVWTVYGGCNGAS